VTVTLSKKLWQHWKQLREGAFDDGTDIVRAPYTAGKRKKGGKKGKGKQKEVLQPQDAVKGDNKPSDKPDAPLAFVPLDIDHAAEINEFFSVGCQLLESAYDVADDFGSSKHSTELVVHCVCIRV